MWRFIRGAARLSMRDIAREVCEENFVGGGRFVVEAKQVEVDAAHRQGHAAHQDEEGTTFA